MHTHLVQKLPLILDPGYVDSPLRVTVDIADSVQPRDDAEP